MQVDEFERLYGARVRSYALSMARKWRLTGIVSEDLHQACWIAICETLPYWKDFEHNKSPFNLIVPQMRKQMERVIRSHFGLKPVSKCKIEDNFSELKEYHLISNQTDIGSMIDLKNALDADPKPTEVARFVLTVAHSSDQASLAQSMKLTRQAINISVKHAKARLRVALG